MSDFNKTEKYCNNCGLKGHLYKECFYPVMSFGHIVFDRVDNKILMIQRKDSLCYIEFLRGKYDIYNIKYIQILINKFSTKEKHNIFDYDFDELWKMLWLIDDNLDEMKYKNKNDYLKGKEKFNKLKSGYFFNKLDIFINLDYFIVNSTTGYLDSEWEFPKGRRNKKESNIECAKREFNEETNYNINDYQLIENIIPFEEEYIGENKIKYKHVYYIGFLTNRDKQSEIDFSNENQYKEIKDIQWFSKEESLNKIRNYHHTRRKIIHQIFNFIENIDSEYIIN
jgi:8-oxo-dGTP pyrophosphatase MutT (NUDIX family)